MKESKEAKPSVPTGRLTGLCSRLEIRFFCWESEPGVECCGDWSPSGSPSLGLRCTGVPLGVEDLLMVWRCSAVASQRQGGGRNWKERATLASTAENETSCTTRIGKTDFRRCNLILPLNQEGGPWGPPSGQNGETSER